MAVFEIITHEQQKMVRAILQGDTIRAEAGALHYWRGQVSMESKAPSAAGIFKSAVSGETIFRPTYTGHGEVFLGPPFFGEFAVLELQRGHSGWILDQGAYLCSTAGVEVSVHRNKAFTALLGGEGFFQTRVSGEGQVVLSAPGSIHAIDLQGETLAVDGQFAVAREASLKYEVRRATKSLVGSVTSGEGLLHYIEGTGRVLVAPVPNVYYSLISQTRVVPTAANNPAAQNRSPIGRLLAGIGGIVGGIIGLGS